MNVFSNRTQSDDVPLKGVILNLGSFAWLPFAAVSISSFFSATRNSASNFPSQNFFSCCCRSRVTRSHALLALPFGLPILPFDPIVSFSSFSRQCLGNFVLFLYKGRKPLLFILLPLSNISSRNSKVKLHAFQLGNKIRYLIDYLGPLFYGNLHLYVIVILNKFATFLSMFFSSRSIASESCFVSSMMWLFYCSGHAVSLNIEFLCRCLRRFPNPGPGTTNVPNLWGTP